jgi:hypothetical protein
VIPVCPITTLRFFAYAHTGKTGVAAAATDIARSWLNLRRSINGFSIVTFLLRRYLWGRE